MGLKKNEYRLQLRVYSEDDKVELALKVKKRMLGISFYVSFWQAEGRFSDREYLERTATELAERLYENV